MITKPTKFTGEFVLSELKAWLANAKKDKNIMYIKDCTIQKDYSFSDFKSAMLYLKGKNSPQYDQISATYSKIKELAECRINNGALKGELNASVSQMNLAHNYKWKNKAELDVIHKGKVDLGDVFGG